MPVSRNNLDPKAPNFVPAPAPGGSKPSSRDAKLQVFHSMTQSRPEVLLKTAVAKVTSGIYTVDANILFDEPRIHNVIDIKKFSIYRKLIRVTAYVIRFINLCKAKLRTSRSLSSIKPLTVPELQEAEKLWLLSCQSTSYHAEITSLKSKDKRTTLVKQLQLFLDQEGFIRCGGRIHNAPLTELTRFPYLLPAKHPLTRMIVLDAHATQLHAGTSALVSHIRQRYWIPSIRQYIQGLLKKCVTCRKVMGKSYRAPDPPPLPKIRV